MTASTPPETLGHPEPGNDNIGRLHMALALFGAPAAWAAQMSLSEIITSYACYPHRAPVDSPLFGGLPAMLDAINAVCLLAALAAVLAAWRAWRKSRNVSSHKAHHVIEVGEGRLKFLAMLALLSALLFIIAIGFTASALFLVSPCGVSI